jgi:GT2 family glycosyltransferase
VVDKAIGVVIPCSLTHLPYLGSAVASLELSELKPLQKIIVTDNFLLPTSILQKLNRLGYLVMINQNRECPAGAKNTGIKLINSECDYVCFLDADDISHPKRLEILAEKLAQSSLSIVGSQTIIFGRTKFSTTSNWIAGHPKRPITKGQFINLFRKDRVVMVYASMMIKRSVMADIGYFDENLSRGEDFDFIKRALAKGYQVLNVPEILYAYYHTRFDNFARYSRDNMVRGKSKFLLFRYLLNCAYRIHSLRLNKIIRAEWLEIIFSIESKAKDIGLLKIIDSK